MTIFEPHRRTILTLAVAGLASGGRAFAAIPSPPFRWTKQPAVTIVSDADDPRIPLVREAVDFWNATFAEIGTRFRLGQVLEILGSVPDAELQALSNEVLSHAWPIDLPADVTHFPGDLVIVLSNANFVSFTARGEQRVVVAIKSAHAWPLTLPNVARNVIAHELGHAVGLPHDADPTLLMCGRPAPCRPDAFRSAADRIFPLSTQERAHLSTLYPADWSPT